MHTCQSADNRKDVSKNEPFCGRCRQPYWSKLKHLCKTSNWKKLLKPFSGHTTAVRLHCELEAFHLYSIFKPLVPQQPDFLVFCPLLCGLEICLLLNCVSVYLYLIITLEAIIYFTILSSVSTSIFFQWKRKTTAVWLALSILLLDYSYI